MALIPAQSFARGGPAAGGTPESPANRPLNFRRCGVPRAQELTESVGTTSRWAKNYMGTGLVYRGEKPDSGSLQGVDCFYSHPVAECEAAQQAARTSPSLSGGQQGLAASMGNVQELPAYDEDCYYHHTVHYCVALRDAWEKKRDEERKAQAVPPHYTPPQMTHYAQRRPEEENQEQVQRAAAQPERAEPRPAEERRAVEPEGEGSGGAPRPDAPLREAMDLPKMEPLAADGERGGESERRAEERAGGGAGRWRRAQGRARGGGGAA